MVQKSGNDPLVEFIDVGVTKLNLAGTTTVILDQISFTGQHDDRGQILSGTEPIIAVRYQIAILCAITGAVAVTSFLIVQQGYRRFFTDAHQLKSE
jgi:hypothetical protein